MVFSQGAAHLRHLHQNNNQKIELDEYQIDILEIMRIDNVYVENIYGDELEDKQKDNQKFPPRLFEIFLSVQRVEELDKIFGHIETKADMYYPTDEGFDLRSYVKAVVAENARNGHDGNHQTANPQNPLDTVFVVHNVNTDLSVVLVVISEK